jgi:uncharacterized protein
LASLVATSFAAGIIDTIAGGGGMLTLPALLSTGLSPAYALATNKLQSIFGTASSSFHFLRQDRVDARKSWLVIVCTLVGAALDATVVQLINPSFLSRLVPWLLIAAAIYILFSPSVGDRDARQHVSQLTFTLTVGVEIGFYDGFFEPGTGSFFALALQVILEMGHGERRFNSLYGSSEQRWRVRQILSNFVMLFQASQYFLSNFG